MITVAVLVVIAPLISVTYSIDKIDNNRSEILDAWLKEFLYNVLIQPFHCIIYISLVGTSMELMKKSSSMNFGTIIFAVIMTSSIFFAEKLIKEIFGFKKSSTLASKIAAGAIFMNVVSNVKNIAAIKNATEDTRANKKLKTVPDKLPDGTDVTPRSVLNAKRDAENQKTTSRQGGSGTNSQSGTNQSNSSGPYNANRRNRRPLRNMKGPIKGIARGYGRIFMTTNGINYASGKYKKHKENQAKRKIGRMDDRQLFEAFSENYRQTKNLSNEELAKEMERLYKTDFSSLEDGADTRYKIMIEREKERLLKAGQNPLQTMKDTILYGSKRIDPVKSTIDELRNKKRNS